MKATLRRPTNKALYFIYSILYTTGFMFCSGTILQTFLLNVGMTDAEISTYNAVIQFVQAAAILAMAFLADKIRRVLKVYASVCLAMSIIAVALVLCVFVRSDIPAVKWIIFAASVITYFLLGVRNAFDYKICYEIFDMKDLGKIMGAAIAVSGLISFGVSAIYSYSVAKLDYYDVMTAFFILSVIMMILSSVAGFTYKKVNDTAVPEQNRGFDLSAFKDKKLGALIIPSFVRGFSCGIIALITVVGFSAGILKTETSSYVSLLTQITTFTGNMLFSVICKRVKTRTSLLVSTIVIGAVLPLSVVSKELAPFLICFAISNFALMTANVSIPVLVCEIVPYEQIGSFTCIRMMIYTVGSVIASVVYKPLSDAIGFIWLFVIAGVMQIICGAGHYAVSKMSEKEKNAEPSEEQNIHS